MDIKPGYELPAAGFSLVRVEPGALKESAESTTDLTGHASGSEKTDEDNSEDRDTDEAKEDEDSEDDQGDEESSVMHFPESLVSDDPNAAPRAAQIVDATKKAVDHPDVQTIFFIGFHPSNLDAQGTKQLKKLVGMVQSWQAWSSSIFEGNVRKQIDQRNLSAAAQEQSARSTYRAKVFDHFFRQAPW